ncbi:TPA_asm: hypothetical protein HUJ06_031979 [Nelumbo nucifera]|uniref:Uncharacterized protein n=1 Tax=Nelumbo nucifera TaxID=4432 RepID=A0A822ZX03_NELNU|nr:TPA_asm: hypothetical protein HUJ06_031979 [Nelumbo nucifera]
MKEKGEITLKLVDVKTKQGKSRPEKGRKKRNTKGQANMDKCNGKANRSRVGGRNCINHTAEMKNKK